MTFHFPDGKTSQTDFGASGYSDYTKHKDKKRKERYLKRHYKNEDWTDPFSAGALSAFILWNKPTIKESYNLYNKIFGFQKLN